jgi:DNA-binding protein Fis
LRPRESSLSAALESFLDVSLPYAEQKEALVEAMTKIYLEKLVAATGGNRSLAARQSGLQRGYLRRLLYKYGLAVSPDEAEDSDE